MSGAGRTVLVTGAQGFIGAWLAERLLDDGAHVIVPRRETPPAARFRSAGVEARCELVRADLADHAALARLLVEHGVDTVFHLAAQAITSVATRSPLATFESNIRATYMLLEACRTARDANAPLSAVVVASSLKAYGHHADLPIPEQLALQPTFPYEVSKACGDMLARSYAHTYELPVAVARLANVYGGGDLNWSRLVPATARALVRGESPVIRSDGTPERDFLYVGDAVEAYLAVARSLERPDLHGRSWNAGAHRPYTVMELVRRLIAASGRAVEPTVLGEPGESGPGDRQLLDSGAMHRELGWEPRWDIGEGLVETYAWYERNLAADLTPASAA